MRCQNFNNNTKVQQNKQNIMSVRKDSLNSSHMYRVCCKHPERMATHQLTARGSNSDAFYCQKCSIMLASQGFNVMKLNVVPVAMHKKGSISSRNSHASTKRQHCIPFNRRTEITSFTNSLQHLHSDLSQKLSLLQQYLIKSQTEYGNLVEQTNKYFKQLEQTIQLQKYSIYNGILNRRVMEESKVREYRDTLLEAYYDVEAMMGDIGENMDAVETVDYGIYNAIMGGYMVKKQNMENITKSLPTLKPIQQLDILLPQIPKQLQSLSTKFQITTRNPIKSNMTSNPTSNMPSNHTSTHNSIVASYKPQCIRTEEDEVVWISEQSSNQEPYGWQCRRIGKEESESQEYEEQESIYEKGRDLGGGEESKENKGDNIHNHVEQQDITIKQIIRSKGDLKEMAFSFDEHSNGGRQLIFKEDSNLMQGSNMMNIRGFEQGKLSKIEERLNSKEVCESRQSLGEYLNISQSREAHFLQDTETLLII